MDALIQSAGSQAVACPIQNLSGGRIPLPMVVIPTVLYFARSYSTSFIGMVDSTCSTSSPSQPQSHQPQGQQVLLDSNTSQTALVPQPQQQFPLPLPPPLALALGQRPFAGAFPPAAFGNAHKVMQRILIFVPDVVLTWFCARVLELSAETTQETIALLKSKRAARTTPLLPALLGVEETTANNSAGETAMVQVPAQQQQQQVSQAMVVQQQLVEDEWVVAEGQEYHTASQGGNTASAGQGSMDAAVMEKAVALAQEILARKLEAERARGGRRERRQGRRYGVSRRSVGLAT